MITLEKTTSGVECLIVEKCIERDTILLNLITFISNLMSIMHLENFVLALISLSEK